MLINNPRCGSSGSPWPINQDQHHPHTLWGAIAPLRPCLGTPSPPKMGSPDSKWLNRYSLSILWLHPVYFKLTSVSQPTRLRSLSRFVSWPWGTLTSSSCKPFGHVRARSSLFFPLCRLSIPLERVRPRFGRNGQGFSSGLPSHVPACCARFLSLSTSFEEQSRCYTKEESKRNI